MRDLNRPVSPLLHDYKPTGSPSKNLSLLWFGVGLGLPLFCVGLFTFFKASAPEPQDAIVEPVEMRASPAATQPVAGADLQPPTEEERIFTDEPSILIEAFAEPPFELLTLKIGRGDTLETLFRRNNLDIGHLSMISRLDEAGSYFRRLQPGDEFEIQHDNGELVSLYSELDLTTALQIDKTDNGFVEKIVERPIETRTRMAYGLIESSLYMSGNEAGLSDKIIMNIAGIFGWDIDFVYDIRAGDSFYVVYEEIWQDGEFVKDGEIVAAEFNNRDRSLQAIRFIDDNGRSDYYTPEGRSVRKAFMRTPVDARVSSRFNPNRRHPVLNVNRPHRGVDYGAPHGTPIRATGDGKVIFRGKKGGYGNVVILQHGGNITTLYAHMSRFAKGSHAGASVRQGQTIGYVGATGLVTAAHLHYEYRLNGVHRNPLTVKLPQAEPIQQKYKERFLASSRPILEELNQFKRTRLATIAMNSQ